MDENQIYDNLDKMSWELINYIHKISNDEEDYIQNLYVLACKALLYTAEYNHFNKNIVDVDMDRVIQIMSDFNVMFLRSSSHLAAMKDFIILEDE